MSKEKFISPYTFPGMNHNDLPEELKRRMRSHVERPHDLITQEFIMEVVCEVTKISAADIISPKRERIVSDARRLYIFNIKKYLKTSFVSIGKSLSNRDHTTVSTSISMYHNLCKTDEVFKRKADKITRLIEHF